MADLTRTLVAALAAFDAGAIAVVLVLYLRAWRRAPTGYRVTPRHVSEVALGALGLVVGIGLAVFDTIGNPDLTWRIPALYLPALLLLAAGVVDVGQLQRRRLTAPVTTDAGTSTPTSPADDEPPGRHHWRRDPTPTPTQPAPALPATPRARPPWRRWGAVTVGALLVALGVFVAVDYTNRAQCSDARAAVVQAALEARQTAVEGKYDADRRLVTILADPGASAAEQRQARVAWLDTLNRLDAERALNPATPQLGRCT